MAISTVASAPPVITHPSRPSVDASARLDRIAAGFLGLGGILTVIVVAAAVTLP